MFDFKKFSEIVHNFSIACAVLGSLYWGYFTFDVLGMKSKAEADLEKTRSKIEEIKKKIDGNSASNIELSHEVLPISDSTAGLIVKVKLSNTGTRNIKFSFNGGPIFVYEVVSKGTKLASKKVYKPKYYEHIGHGKDSRSLFFDELFLLAGVTKEISFYMDVNRESVYYLVFKSPANNSSYEINKTTDGLVWFSSKYIYID